jgi:hypothetical protein
MSRFISKKRALLTAAVTSLVLVAVAIAFYSTTGSGEGSGTTGDGYTTDLAITGDLDDGTLAPGGEVGITGNVHNPNPGSAHVSTVEGTVVAGDEDDAVNGPDAGDCDDSYFTIADEEVDTVLLAQNASNTDDVGFTTTITMDDEPTENQDACKSADLAITWSAVAADAAP